MNYGKALKTIRAVKGLSQTELGKVTNIDPSYISRIENGNRVPTLEILENISKTTSIPLYLFTLLASDKEDIKTMSIQRSSEIANELLNILVSAQSMS